MQAMAARALGSLKIAIDKLKTLYDTPLLSFNPGDEFILRCPYPRSYTDSTKHMHGFSYEKTQALRSHLIFFGTVNDETRSKICIKFVRRYSPEAHRFCAARGHAPKLIAYERLPGGWNMVIMDFLEIVQYPYLQRPGTYRQLRNMTYEDRLSLEKPITSFIHDLHEGGFVHGDIRDTNLFAGLDGKFMLLDFDWAGPITRTFYPMHVNRYDIYRPDGAEDGMEITVDHDLEMLLPVFHGMAAKRRRILSPAEESPPVEELPMDI
jgi:serine/threonine protein kinase